MKFYEYTHIGEFHVNHNEDFLIVEDCGNCQKLIAVMDGCSSGRDSYFASTLMGKLLRKLAKQEAYRAFAEKTTRSIQELLEYIAPKVFEEFKTMQWHLDLNKEELLTTLLLGIIDTKNNNAEILIAGDGLLVVDGEIFEFDSDNKPDYLGYHLNMDQYIWYSTRTFHKSIKNFTDLTLATDGIFSFKNYDGKTYPRIDDHQIIHEFCIDLSNLDNSNKLKRSLIKLKDEYGLMPSDDFTLIRIIAD